MVCRDVKCNNMKGCAVLNGFGCVNYEIYDLDVSLPGIRFHVRATSSAFLVLENKWATILTGPQIQSLDMFHKNTPDRTVLQIVASVGRRPTALSDNFSI